MLARGPASELSAVLAQSSSLLLEALTAGSPGAVCYARAAYFTASTPLAAVRASDSLRTDVVLTAWGRLHACPPPARLLDPQLSLPLPSPTGWAAADRAA